MVSRFLQRAMQRSRTEYENRRMSRVECSDEGWLSNGPDDSGVSFFFSSILFTAIADDNSCQGCATRSAINTPNDTLPLPFFGSRSSFHVLTCRLPLLWKRKNDHAVSVCPILNSIHREY